MKIGLLISYNESEKTRFCLNIRVHEIGQQRKNQPQTNYVAITSILFNHLCKKLDDFIHKVIGLVLKIQVYERW